MKLKSFFLYDKIKFAIVLLTKEKLQDGKYAVELVPSSRLFAENEEWLCVFPYS